MTPEGPPRDRLPDDWWHGYLRMYDGVALLALAALPLAVLAAWVLARRRGSWRAGLMEVGIAYGTVPLVWLTMLPGHEGGVSLVPLRDLGTMSTFQVVGNLLLLAALGLLAPVRFARLASLARVLAVAAAASVLIEVAQHVLRLDRVSSVDDVLLNTAGAGLAALASLPWWSGGRVSYRPPAVRGEGEAVTEAVRTRGEGP